MLALNLEGKVVLITGATGDLGRVMARTLADAGADVALHYHGNRTKAEELQAEILNRGRRALILQADVSSHESVARMRTDILEGLGQVDIVVANAVSSYSWTRILEQPPADFQDQFNTCVLQNVHLAQVFIPDMQERGWGRMIGINTECAVLCLPTQGAYASAKRGMDGIYRVLAKEVGASGVTVNQIAPGWMYSDRDRAAGTDPASGEYAEKVPMKHRGTDQDIANAVAFLASDLAAFITGTILPVTGGTVMPAI